MKKSDSLIFSLSTSQLITLFFYFVIMLIFGGIMVIKIICKAHLGSISTEEVLIHSFIASFASSGMLCSIQYIRRLYKACITKRINSTATFHETLGNLIYFLTRPLFAFVFVTLMVIALLSGMFIITGSFDYIINEKFLYFCVMLSSFIGYSTGKALDRFETISDKKVETLT